jgi:hypothetical protein
VFAMNGKIFKLMSFINFIEHVFVSIIKHVNGMDHYKRPPKLEKDEVSFVITQGYYMEEVFDWKRRM